MGEERGDERATPVQPIQKPEEGPAAVNEEAGREDEAAGEEAKERVNESFG